MPSDSTVPIDLEQLDRYLAGELDIARAADVTRVFGDIERVDDVVTVLRHALGAGQQPDRDRVRALFQERIADARRDRRIDVVTPRSPMPFAEGNRRWTRVVSERAWYVVACILLCVVGSVVSWHTGVARMKSHTSAAPVIYTTGNGQRASITLSDGSMVTLNVASRLEVPADYSSGNHTLRLSGEALFDVRHHEGSPFLVSTGADVARVLGTSFTVRKYATDTAVTVAVRDGKVALRSIVLTAGRQGEVIGNGAVRVGSVDPAHFSFATGVLTLNGVPFPMAVTELNRWYDVDIRLGDPALATRRVAGECAAGSLADLAAILEMMFDVRVVRDGRILTLYAK